METYLKVIKLGGLYGKKQAGGIFDPEGLSPTLTNMAGGGYRMPLIVCRTEGKATEMSEFTRKVDELDKEQTFKEQIVEYMRAKGFRVQGGSSQNTLHLFRHNTNIDGEVTETTIHIDGLKKNDFRLNIDISFRSNEGGRVLQNYWKSLSEEDLIRELRFI